ncbi:sporulation protein [Cohnella xylanilytica]|uniref:sporulation protein n=1 Tax=Cohnella xylanilytica TaxID=557555 RepID=UPI001BB3E029|nr:sporulation protein [Cohnella xylanilytica]
MSIYERMMNRSGGVQVNALLDAPHGVRSGEELPGTVVLKGGRETRQVTAIEFQLSTEFLCEDDMEVVKERGVIYRYSIPARIIVGPGEEKRIPFRLPIPPWAPISMESSAIWLETVVDVEQELSRSDRDEVRVLPHPIVQCFLDAVKLLGLRLEEVEIMRVPHLRPEFPYVQEFEFKPRLPSALEEIEFYYTADGSGQVDFYLEIDRHSRGRGSLFSRAFEEDERHIALTLTEDDIGDPEALADELAGWIGPYLES